MKPATRRLSGCLSLLVLSTTVLPILGCGGSPGATASGSPAGGPAGHSSGASHVHGAGPHDGTVTDWGGGRYHVEFTVDHDHQEATVYVLASDERTALPIPSDNIQLNISQPTMNVTLRAAPQDGDPEGSASRFVGTHESLGVVREYAGTILGVVDDTPYSGDFEEHPHGAHEHEHEHEHGHEHEHEYDSHD